MSPDGPHPELPALDGGAPSCPRCGSGLEYREEHVQESVYAVSAAEIRMDADGTPIVLADLEAASLQGRTVETLRESLQCARADCGYLLGGEHLGEPEVV